MAKDARPTLKITTPLGNFPPNIMLQGYANPPSIFQSEMDFCLGPVSHFSNAYFDENSFWKEKMDGDLDGAAIDEIRTQFNAFVQAIREVAPPEMWEKILERTKSLLQTPSITKQLEK